MGPAGSDETSDVHYGRAKAKGDSRSRAPPQPARHFSSPATDFPPWSLCGVLCVRIQDKGQQQPELPGDGSKGDALLP